MKRFSEDIEFASKVKALFHQGDNYRRTGRNFLLLRVMVENSIESGETVEIIDNSQNIFDVRTNVEMIIRWYYLDGIYIKVIPISNSRFKFELLSGHSKYQEIKIPTFIPKEEEIKEFSKLLLIIK